MFNDFDLAKLDLPGLQQLSIHGCYFNMHASDYDLPIKHAMPGLTKLELLCLEGGFPMAIEAEQLSALTSLNSLSITQPCIDLPEGAQILPQHLQALQQLTELQLKSCSDPVGIFSECSSYQECDFHGSYDEWMPASLPELKSLKV